MFSFIFISYFGLAQQISTKLDSIHRLKISEQEKTVLYKQLLDHHEQKENYSQLGSDAHQVAKWIFKKPGREGEAIVFIKKATNARTKASPFNPKLLRSSYNNLGLYLFTSHNYTESIKAYKKLLSIPNSNHRTGTAYNKIGHCHARLYDPYTAIEYYKKAFKFSQKKKKTLITNHINIADAYKSLRTIKDSRIALKHLQIADSLILSAKKLNKKNLYTVHNDIAGIYFEYLHDTIRAENHYKRALSLAKEMGKKKYLILTYFNLGSINNKRDHQQAIHYYNQSLSYANQNTYYTKVIYFGLGKLENTSHNYQKATNYYYQSLSNFFKAKITPENITQIIAKKELLTIKNKLKLLEVFRETIDNHISFGRQVKDKKHYKDAIKLIQVADKLIDTMLEGNKSQSTKLLLRTLISGIYTSGIEACIATNEINYSFYLLEKNKSLLLIQDISNNSHSNIPTIIMGKTTKLEQEIIHLQDIYKTATSFKDSILNHILLKKDTLEKLRDSVATIYPNYLTKPKNPTILSLSDITYDDNEIIIQYMMTEKVATSYLNTYCLVLSKNYEKLFRLENTKTLHDKIYAIRKQLDIPFRNKEGIENYQKKAYELYQSLIPEEIRTDLKNKKLTIITDHLLNTIPFEALISDLDTGRYLIEDSDIHYTYSLSFEKQNAQKERHAKNDFLGIAPVNFSDGLIKLRNSKKEIETINSYYSGTTLSNEEATKENFIKQIDQYKIIHLATHANASDSIAPWIAFSDQKLVASELGLLNHQAEMVILSACNTSLGEVRSGEGVLSLARGFFKSGAKSVLPTLWSTNDKVTASITSNFYKNLSQGQTKSTALRSAKLTYLSNHTDAEASPHYWAPLILIGANDVIVPTQNYQWLWYLIIGILLALIITTLFLYKKSKK